jgi:hypothetical protein
MDLKPISKSGQTAFGGGIQIMVKGARKFALAAAAFGAQKPEGRVRKVVQISQRWAGYGRLVMFNVTDSLEGMPP